MLKACEIAARQKGTAKGRMRAFLRCRCGEAVPVHVLRAVAGIASWERRLRELRSDEGLAIHIRRLGDERFVLLAGLTPLTSLPLGADLDPSKARAVLERDGFCCRMCGAEAGEPDEYDPDRVVRLLVRRDHRGDGSAWRTCCSVCWEGVVGLGVADE
jgi:5-methylcytosine-specific restriction endonuclease McrA